MTEDRQHPFVRPHLPNPYPGRGDCKISGFRYESRLVLRREPQALLLREGDDAEYVVAAEYRVSFEVDGERTALAVPRGMLTDLSSVPLVAERHLPGIARVGPHLEASIVHDFLYIAWQYLDGRGARRDDWRFANAVMEAGLRAARVDRGRRDLMLCAVGSFIGWRVYAGSDGEQFVALPP